MKLKTILAAAAFVACAAGSVSAEALKLGNEGNYPPFSITEADGSLIGLEPDLARALCERLGRECEVQAMEFNALLPSLVSGRIDMIVSQLFPKPERLEATEFTDPVLTNPETWVVPLSGPDEITPEYLDGKSIGIIKGSWNLPLVREYAPGATIKQYDNVSGIRLDLEAGRLDVGTVGRLAAAVNIIAAENGDNYKLIAPIESLMGNEAFSWAVQKGNTELRDRVNKELEGLFADCTYTNIRKRYFEVATSDREPESCQ